MEGYCIQLDSLYGEMSRKYVPVVEDLAFVHILNALCLEAHINFVASTILKPKSFFEEFDKLSLEAKWLFLPRLLGKTDSFDRGREPFQGFTKIVRWRNALVHYRVKKDPWRGYLPPQFFENLGLTIQQAESSCQTTTSLVYKLDEICGLGESKWPDEKHFRLFSLHL